MSNHVEDGSTERALTTAAAMLARFLHDARATIFITGNREGAVVHANEAVLRALALPSSAVIGHALTGFLGDRDAAQWVARLAASGLEPAPAFLMELGEPQGRRRSFFCHLTCSDAGFTLIGEEASRSDPKLESALFDINNELLVHGRSATQQRRKLERSAEQLEAQAAELAELARRCPLTGLFNRRHLHETLGIEIERAKRGLGRLSVIMFDVDHFKRINDDLGHAAGDAVLTKLGGLLKASLRPYDVAARFGGDEFVILLPGAGLLQAQIVADRVRTNTSRAQFEGLSIAVTLSLGAAEWAAGDGGEALLARADGALYSAKRSGRNRVCVATVDGGET